jgi:hypothetical protein
MSKSLQYVKVFEALQAANGPVTVSQVKAIPGIIPTRLSTYLWEIKKNTGFAVKANRDGRTVVSYELVGSGTAPVATTPAVTKVTKTSTKTSTPKATVSAKATKVSKAKTKASTEVVGDEFAMPKVMTDDHVFDALDDLDTSVASMEDRQFASNYVRGM